jgi:hypothetical protein
MPSPSVHSCGKRHPPILVGAGAGDPEAAGTRGLRGGEPAQGTPGSRGPWPVVAGGGAQEEGWRRTVRKK